MNRDSLMATLRDALRDANVAYAEAVCPEGDLVIVPRDQDALRANPGDPDTATASSHLGVSPDEDGTAYLVVDYDDPYDGELVADGLPLDAALSIVRDALR